MGRKKIGDRFPVATLTIFKNYFFFFFSMNFIFFFSHTLGKTKRFVSASNQGLEGFFKVRILGWKCTNFQASQQLWFASIRLSMNRTASQGLDWSTQEVWWPFMTFFVNYSNWKYWRICGFWPYFGQNLQC